MPLNYSIVLLGNPRKPDDPKKAYARSQVSKELTLKGLSQRGPARRGAGRFRRVGQVPFAGDQPGSR